MSEKQNIAVVKIKEALDWAMEAAQKITDEKKADVQFLDLATSLLLHTGIFNGFIQAIIKLQDEDRIRLA